LPNFWRRHRSSFVSCGNANIFFRFSFINLFSNRNKTSRDVLHLKAAARSVHGSELHIMSTTKRTSDLQTIRQWAEERQGRPARVAETADAGGILRIDFQEPDEGLEEISWEEFSDIFKDRKLDFLYQERTDDGHISRFHKFVSREEG
jgi:hypothetical protein